ncbi:MULTISPECIES: 2'-5' RNA ligase family protein [unclassified Schaalia]|uniref:2'-5' RNA ligase family protein n=1 Tax=unclassified Schaalia TaxID=2691889 RepID=UPI001E62986D|nr:MULTISPECIES: 2'-5' RNA ligase family protein [unclassified Schaalia]MCD4549776.1 2'-5' RNA ligase family protein [Schaalia sp. lx-260]MCD4556792.1 2'-5' RNA ligase family protein [Schaalia sp. lx-100]
MFLQPLSPGEEWLGVVIAIPEPWVSELTQARLSFGDKLGASVPAHITLMPPLAISSDEREEVIRHLRSVAQKHRPFRLTLQGAGSFQPESPVVFAHVAEGASECAMLAEDIRSGPLDHQLRFPYHPHATLAQGVNEDALTRAFEYGQSIHASWLVPGFRLDRVDASGTYSSLALFDLESVM